MNIGFLRHAVYFSSSRQERASTPIESYSGISTPASVRTSTSAENLAEQATDAADRLNWQGIISNDIHQEIIAGINGQKAAATLLRTITRQWQNKYKSLLSMTLPLEPVIRLASD